MPTYGHVEHTIRDYDGEVSRVILRSSGLSPGNFSAEQTKLFTYASALDGIMLGTIQGWLFGNLNKTVIDKPSIQQAQRELKWLVRCHDAVTLRRFSFTIPCADADLLDPAHRNLALITSGPMATYVSAYQALAKSPAGNAAVIDSIELVGRRV